jgi:hypothetical protein
LFALHFPDEPRYQPHWRLAVCEYPFPEVFYSIFKVHPGIRVEWFMNRMQNHHAVVFALPELSKGWGWC